jgi:hypothetical protein
MPPYRTGKFSILEYVAVVEIGTVIKPRSLRGQTSADRPMHEPLTANV